MTSADKICGIYKIENCINNKIYIGQSIDIAKRWSSHRADAFNPNIAKKYKSSLYNAIRKYGLDSFQFSIVERCASEELNDKEMFWIKYYNSNNPKFGYNMTSGGDGSPNANTTKCYQYSLDGYFIKEFESLVLASEETGTNKTSISRCFSGDCHSAGGYMWSLSKVDKIDKYTSQREIIPIYQYSKDGQLVSIYDSMSIAAEKTKLNVAGICACCAHSKKSFGGYVWRKEGDEFSYINNQGNNRIELIIVDDNGKIKKEFSSYIEAQNTMGISRRTIQKSYTNHTKDKYGNQWMRRADYEQFT